MNPLASVGHHIAAVEPHSLSTRPASVPLSGIGEASARQSGPDVRLEIRRDDQVDRVVFEYRKRSDGELVQRFPAKQVVEFYQMMEAMAARVAQAEGRATDAVAEMPAAKGTPGAPSAQGVDHLDSEIPATGTTNAGSSGLSADA